MRSWRRLRGAVAPAAANMPRSVKYGTICTVRAARHFSLANEPDLLEFLRESDGSTFADFVHTQLAGIDLR
jgi:hypothetical protein